MNLTCKNNHSGQIGQTMLLEPTVQPPVADSRSRSVPPRAARSHSGARRGLRHRRCCCPPRQEEGDRVKCKPKPVTRSRAPPAAGRGTRASSPGHPHRLHHSSPLRCNPWQMEQAENQKNQSSHAWKSPPRLPWLYNLLLKPRESQKSETTVTEELLLLSQLNRSGPQGTPQKAPPILETCKNTGREGRWPPKARAGNGTAREVRKAGSCGNR